MASGGKMAGLGMSCQEPDTLEEGSEHFSLVELHPGHKVYDEIKIDFENAGLQVKTVEKLINRHLLKTYKNEKDLLLQQRLSDDPDYKLNEKYLYHGTKAIKDSICEQGLDLRKSKKGCFGKGIYFSDYPKKCIKYSQKGDNPEGYIILMRVLLGKVKVYPKGQKDTKLVREPEKEEPYKGYRFYDSVEGCPVNHKEFVIYESRRALAECIITYSVVDAPEKKVEDCSETDVKQPNNSASAPEEQDVTDTDTTAAVDDQSSTHLDTESEDEEVAASDTPVESDTNDEDTNDEDESGTDDNEFSDALNPSELQQVVVEKTLTEKRKAFMDATGLTGEHETDMYLLRGDLDVDKAVELFKTPQEEELKDTEEEEPEEILPTDSEVSPEKWKALSEEDKEAIISGLVDNFLTITSLDRSHENVARDKLTASEYNLNQAILFYYDEM